MAGARDADWRHVHVAGGDRAAAAPYLPYAAKLLGFTKQEAGRQGLATYVVSKQLEDGAVVIAELRGGIPRITIAPPGVASSTRPPRVREHFVIRLRDEAHPDGLDADHPETLERVEDQQWRTLFYSDATPGYATFPAKKGTYRSNAGQAVFPEGVNHAGNVDWRRHDGVRVSWYGPSTRYFYDPYVLPRSQYGEFVFLLGQPLLDVEAYIAASTASAPFAARWVMGAAMPNDTTLLVVHAVLPATVDFPTGDAPPGDVHVSEPWPPGVVALELCRYRLAPDPTGAAPFLRVLPDSREALTSFTVARAWNPWFFNPDATLAVSHALPETVLVRPTNDFTGLAVAPSLSSQIATLTLSAGTATMATATVSLAPDGTAALASDWRADGTRVDLLAIRTRSSEGFDTRGLQLGEHRVLVREITDFRDIDGRPGSTWDRRTLVWADLREGVLVLAHRQDFRRLNAASPVQFRRIEVWQNGVLVGQHEQPMRTPYDGEYTGLSRLDGSYAQDFDDADSNYARSVAFAPALVLYEMLDYSPQVGGHRYWQGAHGLYLNLAYAASDYFGSVVDGRAPGGNPYIEISAIADTQSVFNYQQRDVHGHASVLGCASYDGTTVYSGWQVNVGGYVDDAHAATFQVPFYPGFPALPGIAARCLPIWLLGTLPRLSGVT